MFLKIFQEFIDFSSQQGKTVQQVSSSLPRGVARKYFRGEESKARSRRESAEVAAATGHRKKSFIKIKILCQKNETLKKFLFMGGQQGFAADFLEKFPNKNRCLVSSFSWTKKIINYNFQGFDGRNPRMYKLFAHFKLFLFFYTSAAFSRVLPIPIATPMLLMLRVWVKF